MSYEIRALSIGGVLDQAVAVVKNHFWLFFKIMLVMFVPAIAIVGLVAAWSMPEIANPERFDQAAQMQYLREVQGVLPLLAVIWLVFFVIVLPLTNAAILYAIANTYLGRPVTVGSAYRRALRLIGPLILTAILVYVVVFLGCLLCLVPGIIFSLQYWLSTTVVVIEGLSGTTAMSRSKLLMKGNWGDASVLWILLALILGMMNSLHLIVPQRETGVIVGAFFQAAAAIFAGAVWTVFYFSCRCKVENFDLMLLAEQISAEEEPAAGF